MSSREEIESRIREQRVAEANKKGLAGQSGKISVVLRTLGSPIVGQVEDVAYLDLEGKSEEHSGSPLKDIPVMDLDGATRPEGDEWGEAAESVPFSVRPIGMHFDGLSRSMHMEIIYKEESSETSLYHRGSLAYRESQGEIVCYIPSEEWEGWISSLYKVAKKIQREAKEQEFKKKVDAAKEAKSLWLQRIASRWGIT